MTAIVAEPESAPGLGCILRYAGHLSVTGGHYDLIPDPDGILERLVAADGPAVRSVEVRGTRHFTTERLIGCLARLSSMTSVEFVNQDITDHQAAQLAGLPGLAAVAIVRSAALTNRGVAALRKKCRTRLEIIGCPSVTGCS